MKGLVFNRWTVLDRDYEKKAKNTYWICQCECGVIKSIIGLSLKKGTSKSCGCLIKDSKPSNVFIKLKNIKFGKLKVLNNYIRKGKKDTLYWECICECGNYLFVETYSLTSGHTKSCGCLKKGDCDYRVKNLSGLEIGILTIKEKLGKDIHGHTMWLCLCKCGNEKLINSSNLIRQKSKSCGCRKRGSKTHGTIYGIYDKENNLVYVGQTIKYNLEERLTGHIMSGSKKIKQWLSSVNYKPKIKAILSNIEVNNLDEQEKLQIQKYKPILNTHHNYE